MQDTHLPRDQNAFCRMAGEGGLKFGGQRKNKIEGQAGSVLSLAKRREERWRRPDRVPEMLGAGGINSGAATNVNSKRGRNELRPYIAKTEERTARRRRRALQRKEWAGGALRLRSG